MEWDWKFVTGDQNGEVILWTADLQQSKKMKACENNTPFQFLAYCAPHASDPTFALFSCMQAHAGLIWWLEVFGKTCITASVDHTAKGK